LPSSTPSTAGTSSSSTPRATTRLASSTDGTAVAAGVL
jgi:hypothetical protein